MPNYFKLCCTKFPQRWIFVIMGFLGFFNAYSMRVCLSMTLTEMTVPLNKSKESIDETCPNFSNNEEFTSHRTEINERRNFEWSEYTQGVILSSFYWGSVVTQLPGAWASEKFGGKHVFAISIFISAITTLLSPLGVRWGDSTALIVLRVIMGLAGGMTCPAINVMLSSWIPLEERSTAGSFVYAGASMGTAFGNTISGLILKNPDWGWPVVFYFFGSLGVVWYLLFLILCYDSPKEHPFISEEETEFLHVRLSDHKHHKPPPVPWKDIISSPPVWAATAANVGHAWGFLTLISDLPKYMASVLKFPIQQNGYLSALPLISMWIGSLVSSRIFDWLVHNKKISSTVARKIGVTISSVGPGVFLIAAPYAGCNRTLVVFLFTIGMTLLGISLPSARINLLDLSPNYSGSLMGATNQFAALTGVITPYIVGVLTPNQTLAEWRIVFWIMFMVFILTNLLFIMYGSGQVQGWNNPEFGRRYKSKKKLENLEENVEFLSKTKRAQIIKSSI